MFGFLLVLYFVVWWKTCNIWAHKGIASCSGLFYNKVNF